MLLKRLLGQRPLGDAQLSLGRAAAPCLPCSSSRAVAAGPTRRAARRGARMLIAVAHCSLVSAVFVETRPSVWKAEMASSAVRRRPVTTAFVQDAAGRVLVVQRSDRVSTYPLLYGGVSGGVEGSESLLHRALKEVRLCRPPARP